MQRDHLRPGNAGRCEVLVCSLLASLPECFANKHTHTGLQSKQIDRVATDLRPNSVGVLQIRLLDGEWLWAGRCPTEVKRSAASHEGGRSPPTATVALQAALLQRLPVAAETAPTRIEAP